jgi:hypothetical protein
MRKNVLLIVILVAGLASCKSKSAFDYSQDIVAKEKSLAPQISTTEDKVGRFLGAEQFDSVAAAGEKMEKLVQTKIDEINAMKVPGAKEADNFKAATLKYFQYIKSIYTGYKQIGLASTADKRQELMSDLQELAGKKQEVINDMQTAQRKYASANGFRVEN